MTEIVLLMWLANSVEGLRNIMIVGGGLAPILVGLLFLLGSDLEDIPLKRLSKVAWIGSAILVLGILLPSKGVIHAAIAVKAGEQAISTETGGKAMQALNATLDRIISEAKGK